MVKFLGDHILNVLGVSIMVLGALCGSFVVALVGFMLTGAASLEMP